MKEESTNQPLGPQAACATRLQRRLHAMDLSNAKGARLANTRTTGGSVGFLAIHHVEAEQLAEVILSHGRVANEEEPLEEALFV
jgi:hypothetical protein